MSRLAGSDLKLFLLLLLASNPKYSHSAVCPLRPAGSKTSMHVPNPTPDCFNNTLQVNRDASQVFFDFVFVSIVLLILWFIIFFSCVRPL